MELAEKSPDESRLEQLRTASRRRMWFLVGLTVAVTVGTFIILSIIDPHHHEHRHRSTAGRVIVVAVLLLVPVAVGVVLRARARRRHDSIFASLLVTGLPRTDRRGVMRAVRNGVPSDDPVLREAEREVAARFVRLSSVVWFWLVLLALSVLLTIAADSWRERLFRLVPMLSWIAILIQQSVMRRRARRYLAALGEHYGAAAP